MALLDCAGVRILTMCANRNQPRQRRMKRKARLQSAKIWMTKYSGKNLIKGYQKHFGVDWSCAVQELQMMGVQPDPQYLQKLKQMVVRILKRNQSLKQIKKAKEMQDFDPESDESFSYIAGFTHNGLPYGLTWEEMSA